MCNSLSQTGDNHIILLLNWYPLPNGVCILGQWCSTPCTEAKATLNYVPIWLILLHFIFYRCPSPEVFLFIPLSYSSIPSSSASAVAVAISLGPAISMPAFSRHRTPTRTPCVLSVASHRPRINHLAMYCATVFCLHQMYTSFISKPISSLATSDKLCSHLPSSRS